VRIFTLGLSLALGAILWLSPIIAGLLLLAICLCVFINSATRVYTQVLICGFLVGLTLGQFNLNRQLEHQYADNASSNDHLILGTVSSVPKRVGRRTSFLFNIEKFVNSTNSNEPASQGIRQPKTVSLSWYGYAGQSLKAGEQWQLTARLKPPSSLGNPGGFNYERWLFQHRVHATGYVREKPKAIRVGRKRFSLNAIRESIAAQIILLPDANAFASLVQGLTVGVTNSISEEHWLTLRHSGTAHLLAISGLHIGLISAWFYWLAGWAWFLVLRAGLGNSRQRITKPIFSITVSLIGASLYAALAGFSLPTQRALVMLAVLALAILSRRTWPPATALIVALLLVLLLDPLVVLSVGFWLSFGTVFAIFYLNNGRLHRRGNKVGALLVHLKLGIVLLPVSALFFQQGAFIAPVANAIAVPVVALFVVPLSFMVAILAPIWPMAANGLLMFDQWILSVLLRFLDGLLLLPGSNLPLSIPGPVVFYCVIAGLLLLFSPRGLRLRWFALPLLLPSLVFNIFGAPVRGFELHVLDVGQGLSAVVFTKNHTVLFDTGKRLSENSTMFDRVVQPFLVSKGRSSIDVAVLSHGDDDHAGGLSALLAQHNNVKVFASDTENLTHPDLPAKNATPCEPGKTFVFDNVRFAFLHPHATDTGSKNNLSCVLLVHFGKSRVLLTGDIESESEQLLLSRMQQDFPVTALVAPHHGSRSSSTASFVSAMQPEAVIFAAGERNAYGFPHADVIERYQYAGAKTYTTGVGGAVHLVFDRQGLAAPIVQFWNNRRRYRH